MINSAQAAKLLHSPKNCFILVLNVKQRPPTNQRQETNVGRLTCLWILKYSFPKDTPETNDYVDSHRLSGPYTLAGQVYTYRKNMEENSESNVLPVITSSFFSLSGCSYSTIWLNIVIVPIHNFPMCKHCYYK